MKDELKQIKERSKQMMIKGLEWDQIMMQSNLRQEDLKRIQKNIIKTN